MAYSTLKIPPKVSYNKHFKTNVNWKGIDSNVKAMCTWGKIQILAGISGEGNGNSLQCFCLENPMDRGDW